ncbi:MAG: FliI/YscN family ATPase [Bdellovibrionota bacterium]|jgi:flagellum-specific ATP synthase
MAADSRSGSKGREMSTAFQKAASVLEFSSPFEMRGTVTDVKGLIIEGTGPFVSVGSTVDIHSGSHVIQAQVVGFKKDRILVMPFGEPQGLAPGAAITATGLESHIPVGPHLLGRVIDGMGRPLDGKPLIPGGEAVPVFRDPPNPVSRRRVSEPFDLGVRAMNGFLTMGEGQRMGIMAGSGVGKSTLLGMIAKHSTSEVNVIGLIGERGREVREFIERDLGPEGLKRSVVVVATGNESALMRIRASLYATALSEYFRDQGRKVVLMLDSVTRLAMAQREIGLAIGEPPSTRGYTPSVFSLLPKLLERAGTTEGEGSITALYTVLVEGDDMNEPVADAVRGILDGHVVLDRSLASKGHFPAIDILQSTSRVMNDLAPSQFIDIASQARDILATYRETEDLITIGAYKAGQNPRVDRAVGAIDNLNAFLRQKPDERVSLEESCKGLIGVVEQANQKVKELYKRSSSEQSQGA